MNLDFLKINSIPDLLQKYNFSWLTTAGLTLAIPKLELLLPIIIQVLFIVFTQLFAIAIDYLRLKYLSQSSKTKININDNKLNVDIEIKEKDKTDL